MNSQQLTKADLNKILNNALLAQDKRFDQKLNSVLEKQKKEIISEITDFIEISLAPFLDKIIEKSKNHKKILDEHEKQLSNHEDRINSLEKVQVAL